MALKPRTFRRVVLLGSLVSVVLILLIGYFFVRPWQAQRKLDSMRIEGMAAAQSGDYKTASILIGRYLSRTEDPDPEILLSYSRARVKFQVSDYGHIRVAIRSYRSYLKVVPDDVVVAKELLPLFNFAGMSLEAKTLGESLRTRYNDTSLEVLREERLARQQLDEDDPVLDELYTMSVEHPDAEFKDFYQYVVWLAKVDRRDDAQAFIDSRLSSGHTDVPTELVALWLRMTNESVFNAELVEHYGTALLSVLGIDQATGQWIAEPTYLSPEIAIFVDRVLNRFGLVEQSLMVRLTSARIIHDTDSMVWSARRLYWKHDFETLYGLGVMNADDEMIPDVLGYQALANQQEGNEDKAASLRSQIEGIDLDFRAGAWSQLFHGLELFGEGQLVDARSELKAALKTHPSEPTFYLALGDIYAEHGRINRARDVWLQAQDMVLDSIGNVNWVDPSIRLINAYTRAGRMIEAMEFVDRLVFEIAPNNPISTMIWLRSYAALARTQDIDRSTIEQILERIEQARGSLSAEQLAVISPQIATLYASIGNDDEARAALSQALAASPSQQVMLEIIDIDQRYELGIAQGAGVEVVNIVGTSPRSALRYALNLFAQTQEVEQGLEIIERGLRASNESDAYQWSLVRARYLDSSDDPRAKDAWAQLHEQHPDDIELLYQIVESNSMGKDIAVVDEIIDEIAEKTSTLGQTIPSRLRLARATAIINTFPEGTPLEGRVPTRAMRENAIEIVRSVVTGELKNVQARNMLGRLLAMRASPTLAQGEMFESDFEGAIDQYVTISRQLKGRSAQKYLLEAIDLSFENLDAQTTNQYLLEFSTRFADDIQVLPEIARRFENINELDQAATLYRRVFQSVDTAWEKVETGLSLANVYNAQNERALVLAMLNDLRDEPEMDADHLIKLASFYSKSGDKPEGDELAKSGERYGLDPIESKLVYAKYAGMYISAEEFEAALNEIVLLDPTNEEAWTLLIRRLVQEQRFDEAQELIARAISEIPENKDLRALSVLAQGNLESASVLFESGAIEANEFVVEAVARVDAYMAKKSTAEPDALRQMLVSMLDDFPEFTPIQRFGISELSVMRAPPALIAQYADRAGRLMPSDSLIMRLAGQAYLQASNPGDALRVARLWRANVIGSPLEPDLIIAQALIMLKDYQGASQKIAPYLQGAIDNPNVQANAGVLYVYSHSMLMLGEDPRTVADRIEPLLNPDNKLINQVWLNLVSGSVPTHQEAARWIEIFMGSATPEDARQIANAWLIVIDRFNTKVPAYAQAAIELLEPLVDSHPEDLSGLSNLTRLYLILSQSVEDPESKLAYLKRAIELLDQADRVDQSNFTFLAQSALYETQVGNFEAAESKYRELLARNIEPGRFSATIMNNLAMLLERKSTDSTVLNEALEFSIQASELVGIPSFWGTRGWVELALDRPHDAEASFQRSVDQDPENLEGWVGLAIAQHAMGQSREDDSTRSFNRVMEIISTNPISDELMDRLKKQGDAQWTSVLNP